MRPHPFLSILHLNLEVSSLASTTPPHHGAIPYLRAQVDRTQTSQAKKLGSEVR